MEYPCQILVHHWQKFWVILGSPGQKSDPCMPLLLLLSTIFTNGRLFRVWSKRHNHYARGKISVMYWRIQLSLIFSCIHSPREFSYFLPTQLDQFSRGMCFIFRWPVTSVHFPFVYLFRHSLGILLKRYLQCQVSLFLPSYLFVKLWRRVDGAICFINIRYVGVPHRVRICLEPKWRRRY